MFQKKVIFFEAFCKPSYSKPQLLFVNKFFSVHFYRVFGFFLFLLNNKLKKNISKKKKYFYFNT